jgi:NAD-dependent dihydropyrimidine dehydrogenase PreA subunit
MIELVSSDRCIKCDVCVEACPDNVFDSAPGEVPTIARIADCQTCFLCELYCPTDALYVSPFKEQRELVDEAILIASGLLGATGARSAGVESRLRGLSTTSVTACPKPMGRRTSDDAVRG